MESTQAATGEAEQAALAAEAAHVGRPRHAREHPRSAGGGRAHRAAPRHRGQDAEKAALGRDQEHVAAGDGQHHGGEGLRDCARLRARRRPRRADRPVGADALDGARRSATTIRLCPRTCSRCPPSCRDRPSWRAAWRRSAWCRRETGRASPPFSSPGSGSSSREGDLWRWDGFAAAAHAPTGAARRLAERARLADIEAELVHVRGRGRDPPPGRGSGAGRTCRRSAAEKAAREAWRDAQREAETARGLHAAAERDIARNAARVSALDEAKTRITSQIDEARAAKEEAERGLADLPSSTDLEGRLAAVRTEIEGKRSRLAEVRAEAQALAREAERREPPSAGDRRRAPRLDRAAQQGAQAQIGTLETRARRGRPGARRARRCAAGVRRQAPVHDQRDRGGGRRPARGGGPAGGGGKRR